MSKEIIWTPSLMGLKGGAARVEKGLSMVSKKRRREISKLGAAARWGKRKPAGKESSPKKATNSAQLTVQRRG
jgi:hypothetical protein